MVDLGVQNQLLVRGLLELACCVKVHSAFVLVKLENMVALRDTVT